MYHGYRLQVIADRQLLIPHTICGLLALLAGPVQFFVEASPASPAIPSCPQTNYLVSVFIGAFTRIGLAAVRLACTRNFHAGRQPGLSAYHCSVCSFA